jgi:hypothetical protein
VNIAIVILNWNGKELLETFLPSVTSFSKEATIYIADNASTDDSVSFIKTNYPSIKIIINSENGGYAKGYNDALKQIKADVYCLLNSDVAVSKNWLHPIIATFKLDKNIVAIQPKIIDYKNKQLFEYAGAGGGLIDQYGYPYCRGRVFNSIEIDRGQYNDTRPIFWASGACLFVKAKTFHELDGFDSDFFAHQEEIDLCWRIQNTNKKIYYVGTSEVYHLGGGTLDSLSPQKTFLNFRNSLFSILKNVPKNKGFGLIFSRLCLDGIAGLKFLFEGRPQHMIAIIRAHFSFYTKLNKMLRKRSKEKKRSDYYTRKSIVWDYFVSKKIK